MPAIPEDRSFIRWGLGGASVLVLTRVDDMKLKKYASILKEFGLMNESNLLDTEKVKLFIDTAFQKQSEVRINLMGIPFKFDASDDQALLEIMEIYKE
ncbi:MAG: hypothetical protein ACLU5J_12850 [Christensenellales bacterium]